MPDIKELKKLSPEERIRKLKEIAEKDKKEIEDAQELIKQSEDEIEEERKIKEQIPIPQVKAFDISELFTQEEKDMYRVKRMVGPDRKKEGAEEKPLEKAVEEEEIKLTEEQQREQQRQYMRAIEGKPIENIYSGVANIINDAKETGYVTNEQRNFMAAAYEVAKHRAQDESYARREEIQEQFNTMKRFMQYVR